MSRQHPHTGHLECFSSAQSIDVTTNLLFPVILNTVTHCTQPSFSCSHSSASIIRATQISVTSPPIPSPTPGPHLGLTSYWMISIASLEPPNTLTYKSQMYLLRFLLNNVSQPLSLSCSYFSYHTHRKTSKVLTV